MPHSPQIQLPLGLRIGYRGRFPAALRENCLAATGESIELDGGRHLLLARNGRGKTTLLKTIAGILPSLSGEIRCRGSVQYLDEDLRFDSEMRPRHIFRALLRRGQLAYALAMADRIELDVDKAYGKLSKGNRQKVGLIITEARAREAGPQILLLDEPFSGLDFAAREVVDEIWRENAADIVRLVCVHPDEPTLKADGALVIRDGRIETLPVEGSLDWIETRHSLN